MNAAKLLILSFLVLTFYSGTAQDLSIPAEINDLQKKLNTTYGTEKVEVYNLIALKILEDQPQKAMLFGDSALQLAEELQDSAGIMTSLFNLGEASYSVNDYRSSEKYYNKVLAFEINKGNDSIIADLYISIGLSQMYLDNYSGAFENFRKASSILEEINDKESRAQADFYIASNFYYQCDYSSSIKFFNLALNYALMVEDLEFQADIYNYLGVVYFDLGSYDKALNFYMKSLEIAEYTDNKVGQANTLNNIGIVYYDWNFKEKALEYYQKSMRIEEKYGSKKGIAGSYNNIGIIYSDWDQNNLAITYYEKALELYKECNDRTGIGDAKNNIGESYAALGEYSTALKYLQESLQIEKENENGHGLAQSLHATASVYLLMKNYPKALDYNDKSYFISDSLQLFYMKMTCEKLYYEIYEQLNNYKKAFQHFREYKILEDSVYNKKFHQKLSDVQLNYELEKENENRNKTQKSYSDKKDEIRIQRIYLIIIFILMVIFGILIYYDFRSKNKTNEKLKEINNILNEQKLKLSETLEDLSKSESKYRTLVENSLQAMLIVQDGRIIFANSKFEELSKYNHDELIKKGRRWLNLLIHPSDIKRSVKNVRETLEGKISSPVQEYKIIRKDHEERIMQTLSSVVNYYSKPAMLIVAIDVTERKKAEQKLINSEQNLREVNAMKDKFFSIIAHDLKNPFSSIMGFANLLNEAYDNYSEKQRKAFIKNICESSENTYKLLQNLLEWSGTQTGNIEFTPKKLDLKKLIDDNVKILNSGFLRKKIEVVTVVPVDTFVFADENMTKVVVRNLLSNAVKFTSSNGKIEIKTRQDKNMVDITIIDNGTGISSENIKRLFRIDDHYKSKGTEGEMGSGLGLILCREFVEKNGGNIYVTSDPGKGSSFTFTLPVFRDA